MKVIAGNWRKHEFINTLINSINDGVLIIEIGESSYPYEGKHVYTLKSDKENLIENVIKSDYAMPKWYTFIIFTDDNLDNAEHYKEKFLNLDREIMIVLNSISSTRINSYIEEI